MAEQPQQPVDTLPLPAGEGIGSLSYWKSQIQASQKNVQNIASTRNWDRNLQSYLGRGLSETPVKDTVTVQKDYALVEGTKALLFFQRPDVSATGSAPEYEQAAPLVAEVVNHYLELIDAKSMVDEVLMDLLCPAGFGVCKIGYEAFVDPQEPELMVPDAVNPLQPQLGPDGQPVLQPKIVREQYFLERVPPKRFRFPVTFIGSNFDKAGWLAYDFDMDRVVAERLYDLTPEEASNSASTPDPQRSLLASDVTRATAAEVTDKITITEIWYRASDFDPTVGDPEIVRQLVYMDGRDEPLVHRNSPYQTISDGRRIGGMKGFPLHVLTLRYVSDQAIPPSDCSMSRQQVDELSLGRTQMVQQRDRAVPLVMADASRLPKEALDKIENGVTQEIIVVSGMDAGNPPMQEVRRASYPRENFGFNDIINRDIAEIWALGANQLGVETDTRRTATEASLMHSATDTRMDSQRVKVLRWYSRLSEKLLALIQMFATEQQYVRIVGPDGLPALRAWDRDSVAGDFSITLAPDSSQRVDAAADKKRAVDIFGLLGNDPLVNQLELRKWLFRKLGMPDKLVKAPEPKPPEQPQVSVSIKGDDLNPMMPQYVNVTTLLAAGGIGLQPAQGPTPPMVPGTNPGSVPPVSPLNKRTADEGTGKLPGAGQAPAANV